MPRIPDKISLWESYSAILLRLVLPLSAVSVALLLLSSPVRPRDVMLNLSTDLITIIITVLYVDWVLRKHQEASWHDVHKHVSSEAGRAAHSFISSVATHLDLETELFPSPVPTNAIEIQQFVLSRAATIDRFKIEDALARLNTLKWARLMAKIRERRDEMGPLIAQFGPRLGRSRPPNQRCGISN